MNKSHLLSAAVAAALTSTSAFATNGMMLEGYGARATAMGGAGVAIDNGNSSAMTNPAALSFMEEGSARFGAGLRMLGPDITSSFPAFGVSEDSDGTAYWMPSFSYMRKTNGLTYGVAMLAQGGMGTEYGSASPLFAGGRSCTVTATGCTLGVTALSGQEIRSEVGVGGLMFPISKQVSDRLNLGASVDFVWAMMDLQLDMDGAQIGNLIGGNGGSMTFSNPAAGAALAGQTLNYGRFDFSDNSDFTGKAKATGWAGKLGMTYQVSDRFTFGASYRSKTSLSDLESDAKVTFNVGGFDLVHNGEIRVVDFQWPEQLSIGGAFKANDRLLLSGEIKYLGWQDVMKDFKLSFTPSDGAFGPNGANAGVVNVSMDQNWDDQYVFSIGAEYQVNEKLSLRAGLNLANNPVPSNTYNPLFPATIENHITGGFGYQIDEDDKIGFSFTYAPEVKITGNGALNSITGAGGFETTHSQFNMALNYSHTF